MKVLSFYRFAITAFYAAFGLAMAFGAEKFYDILPCSLCLYTRYAFLGVLITSLLVHTQRNTFLKALQLASVAVAFSVSAHHLGVESHWWQGPASCSRKTSCNDDHTMSLAERLEKIKSDIKKKIILCDHVSWRILGISATVWNTIGLLFFLIGLGLWWKKD